jgi:glucokinase
MILAGDVGGTKANLALYDEGASPRRARIEKKLMSRDARSLEELVLGFLSANGLPPPRRAVFGVAGPVVNNRSETTNLPWVVSGDTLSAAFGGADVRLVNDLEAAGWGVATLGAADVELLQRGERAIGNRALIAAGTGLGKSILFWDGARHRPVASEGGHVDFAPNDAVEDELLSWLRARYGHASVERVLSGPGLADLYRFFSDTGRGAEPPEVAARFRTAIEPARIVTATALDGTCERARLVVEKFVEIYGAETGNLALTCVATAGMFVGGGIAPPILSVLRDGRFKRAFRAKGRLQPLLERIPVAVILDDRAGLWGVASLALETPAPSAVDVIGGIP